MSDLDDEYGDDIVGGQENNEFDEKDELTKENSKEFDGELKDIDELADEYDQDSDEEFKDIDELADEYDQDSDEELKDIDEIADEYDQDSDEEFKDIDELADEYDNDSDESEIENKEIYENIDSQSTILIHEDSETEIEYQQEPNAEDEKDEEVIEPDPQEYEQDLEPLYDPDEIDFIRDMEELGRMLREAEEERSVSEEELEEYDKTAFNAEQAYQIMKEKNEEKEIEEDEQHLEEQIAEQNEEKLTGEIKEEGDELPKEITDSEEFEYLWEEYNRLEQEGKSLEEISELMREAEETYQLLKEFEEELEEIYKQQEKQELKSIDHKNEEEPEDYRKEVDSVYEAEYFIDAEIQLQAEGKSTEEVTEEMQEVEDKYDFIEEVEAHYEKQKTERLKSVNHEDKEDDDDQREEIDRVDVIERVAEAEGEFHKQGKSQKEIDKEIEKIANSFYESEMEVQQNDQETGVRKDLRTEETGALEKIKQEDINESIEEENKLEIDESDEGEYLKLQQLYRQETGKRPIYRRRETIGFSQWLKDQKAETKKVEETEEKKREDEKWKKILKEWIKESKEELLNSELKLVLKEILQEYDILEDLDRKCIYINLTDKERDKWISYLKKYESKYPIHVHLLQNIYGFKVFIEESHPWDINRIKTRFLRHLVKKYEILKQNLRNLNFKNIKSSGLREFITRYQKFMLNEFLKVKYPNRGFQITKQFFEWLKSIGNTDKIVSICKEINTNQELFNFFIYLIKNSSLSLKKISEEFKLLGFNIHSSVLGKYAKKILRGEYKIRFPSGKKKIQLFNTETLSFHNLLNKVLLQKFHEFRETFPKNYPNTGRIIGDKFISWIKKNLKSYDEKQYLLKLIERINRDREITQYIINLIINSKLTQLDIVNELWKKNLKISRETVRKIAEQNLPIDAYKERFSRYKKSYHYDKLLSLNNSLYQNLLNPVLHTSFKNYYQKIGKYPNIGRKIANSFKSWIKKSKYELHKRQRILNLIENINKNNEIESFIIDIIQNSITSSKKRTSLGEISRMFKKFGLDVSRMTVSRIALKKVFNNNLKIFQKYFKPGQDEEFKDINLQNLFFDDIINFGLVSTFKSYRKITSEEGKELYPNIGIKISPYFIEWIKKNFKNEEEKQKLIQLSKKINNESQILQLILHRTLFSDLNISEIALEMENLGLNGQRGTISKSILKYIYNNDKKKLNLRFPSDFNSELGTWTHICIKDLLTKHFTSKN
ncbi:MAG: hypothetical protein ACFFBV_13805, partial [Promethearchaeota archaeon]